MSRLTSIHFFQKDLGCWARLHCYFLKMTAEFLFDKKATNLPLAPITPHARCLSASANCVRALIDVGSGIILSSGNCPDHIAVIRRGVQHQWQRRRCQRAKQHNRIKNYRSATTSSCLQRGGGGSYTQLSEYRAMFTVLRCMCRQCSGASN